MSAAAWGARAARPRFECDAWLEGDAALVEVCGELDRFTCEVLRADVRMVLALACAPRRGAVAVPLLVFDLERMTHCDGDGLAVLVAARDEARARGGRAVFAAGRECFARAVADAGLTGGLALAATVDEALCADGGGS